MTKSTGETRGDTSSTEELGPRTTSGRVSNQKHVSADEIFSVLSHRRRRFAIHYLKRVEGPVKLGDLAEQVAAWEYDKEIHEVTSDERKRVYTALQGSHLIPMEKAGIVLYDKDRGIIESTSVLGDIDMYVDFVPSQDFHWSTYYLALSIGSAILLVFVGSGSIPTGWFNTIHFAGFVVGAFLFSAIVHKWESRYRKIGRDGSPPELEYE